MSPKTKSPRRAVAPLRYARALPLVLPLEDGRVLVAGGKRMEFEPRCRRVAVAQAEVWDPRRDRWEPADRLVDPAGSLKGVAGLLWDARTQGWRRVQALPPAIKPGRLTLGDGTRLSAGGAVWQGGRPHGRRETPVATVRLSPLRGRPRPTPLPSPRVDPTLTELPGQRVLVSGGYETGIDFSWETECEPIAALDVIELATGRATPAGTLVCPRYQHAVVLLPAGVLMVVGGSCDEETELAAVEILPLPDSVSGA